MLKTAIYELNGLTIEILTKADNVHHISGGDVRNPTWEEYKADFEEYFHPNIELLKYAIIQHGWLGEKADTIANHYCFKFSTGEAIAFSWRAWGDLMQAIVNKKEGYMKYYM